MAARKLNRKGAFVVLFAILLPIIIIFLGFSIDFANMQRSRNELRVIADLAAKAASDTLSRTDGDQAAARETAKRIAFANMVAGEPLTLTDNEILFGRSTLNDQGVFEFDPDGVPANAVRVLAARDDQSSDGAIPLFFGRFYGKPTFQNVQTASAGFQSIDIVLVLDRSGSMKRPIVGNGNISGTVLRCLQPPKDSRWRALASAVNIFLDQIEQTNVEERVGLVTFAGGTIFQCDGDADVTESITLDSELDTQLNPIRDVMKNYSESIWSGSTDIEGGLRRARAHLNQASNPFRNQVIIVLTDGRFTVGEHPETEAGLAADDGIVVHTITFSDSAKQQDMVDTAIAGRGQHFHAPDEQALQEVFELLAASISVLQE